MMTEYFLGPAQTVRGCTIIPVIDARVRLSAGKAHFLECAFLSLAGVIVIQGRGGYALLRRGFDPNWEEVLAYSTLARKG